MTKLSDAEFFAAIEDEATGKLNPKLSPIYVKSTEKASLLVKIHPRLKEKLDEVYQGKIAEIVVEGLVTRLRKDRLIPARPAPLPDPRDFDPEFVERRQKLDAAFEKLDIKTKSKKK